MKILSAFFLVVSLLFISFSAAALEQNLNTTGVVTHWPGPKGANQSADTRVFVQGEEVFVYETHVNNQRFFSNYPTLDKTPVVLFDFTGTVTVEIHHPTATTALIRPLSAAVTPTVSQGVISFTLDKPQKLTIEFNGQSQGALHLFSNLPEENPPTRQEENLLYFGPGIHKLPVVRLKSNQSVYLAGGAILQSKIVADSCENITVYGRGIIDGSIYDRWTQLMVPIDFNLCKNVTIKDITLLDPAGWTVNTFGCADVLVQNINIISARPNSDGLTAQSCKNYRAENCFVRSWDDSLVVKNYGNGTSENIVFSNMLLWTDLAQSCEVGYETRGPKMDNIIFENITVLHNFHKPVMSIHNSDHASISNVAFRNIIVEDAQMGEGDAISDGFLIDLTIAQSQWTQSKERGTISNIVFENIQVLSGKFPPSRIVGYDNSHLISGVFIKNLTILGQPITSLEEGQFTLNNYANDITIE